jgi:hypothetical protein
VKKRARTPDIVHSLLTLKECLSAGSVAPPTPLETGYYVVADALPAKKTSAVWTGVVA